MQHRRLIGQMLVAVTTLALMTAVFLVGVWAVCYVVLAALDTDYAAQTAVVVTVVTIGSIGYLEYRHVDTIERIAGGEPVDPETVPGLYRTTTKVAAQLDVPVPTIVISDRRAPEAMAIGFRPRNVHLVLSSGTLEALEDPAELEAVIAHELSHVKNKDAMVMTVISLPLVLSRGLGMRLDRMHESWDDWANFFTFPLRLLSLGVWFVSKTTIAGFSRARELAADRAAVEVLGSPAPLATALTRLDREITRTPDRDLREVTAISSLSILPLEPEDPEPVMLGPEGEQVPAYWGLEKRMRRLFRTHPRTANRLQELK